MRSLTSFNEHWTFEGDRPVTLPHTAVELPLAYFDERSYQRVFTYEKAFAADPSWSSGEVSLVFDGAMTNATVSINGTVIATHRDGYTPFVARLTDHLVPGNNRLTVTIDGAENPAIPPFGGRIDYLTYAGIYRDVWLKITPSISIGSVKIETPDVLAERKSVRARISLDNPQGLAISGELTAELRDGSGRLLATTSVAAAATMEVTFDGLAGIALWDIEAPALYSLVLKLGDDEVRHTFGFRSADFTTEGFRLNGRLLKLRGLNRHQSFPYAGYALGRAAQERDAEILKRELHVNLVRTSHYPQSPWFLDHCDRIGLLVFEEIPGWQHIGGPAWKAEATENVRRMITRDWNHPSIVLWGVRINESGDDHDFYAATDRLAHELDPTRQTGGVRCITDSEFLEDVYTMNDFILGNEELGGNRLRTPLRPIAETTGLAHPVPYLVTEFGGHMYPTKIYDQEQRQDEHVRRHLQVLNAAYGDPGIAGAVGWCAFDYNTHKDFGSGDRICHHGVMDMFREPKFAAYVYASQCEPSEEVILEPVTVWSRGERNIGGVFPLTVLTNCDAVEIRFGDSAPKRLTPDRAVFPHLPHAPVIFDRHHFSSDELGLWGMEWLDATITGYLDGAVVKTLQLTASPVATRLEVTADSATVRPGDSVRVLIRALDQTGRKLPFLFEPVEIAVEGPARLVGPALVSLRGGSVGFWITAAPGVSGDIRATVRSTRLGAVSLDLRIE